MGEDVPLCCCSQTDWASWINTLFAGLAALGTLAAVAYALFSDRLRERRAHANRALLDMALRFEPPDCHKSGDAYYFRIWVENAGHTRARSVQVFLKEVARRSGDGFELDRTFLPQNLIWSHQPNPDRERVFVGISPKIGRHCELAAVFRDVSTASDAVLSLRVQVRTKAYFLTKPGRYRLTLLLAASNVLPVRKTIDIDWSGKWYDNENEMLSKGISIVDTTPGTG